MRKMAGRGKALSLLPLLVVLALTACVNRSVEPPSGAPPSAAAPAPATARAFAKIISIDDHRKFAARLQEASAPSLQDSADMNNADRLARAVGRERHADGTAGANLFLPAGETVAGLVHAAIERALREKGYELVREGSPHYDAAATLSVEIAQFWLWQTPGVLGNVAEFRAAVVMTGDVLTEPSTRLEGYASDDDSDAQPGRWRQILQAGVDDLGKKIAAHLKPPAGS